MYLNFNGVALELQYSYIYTYIEKLSKTMFDDKWVALISRWNYEEIDDPNIHMFERYIAVTYCLSNEED
jgi:hypothetical protein